MPLCVSQGPRRTLWHHGHPYAEKRIEWAGEAVGLVPQHCGETSGGFGKVGKQAPSQGKERLP
ncbi:hypothetical protein GCM10009560_31850 [Nonomuraea longicatena]|uniref:Uncharacterized protein n=1 Tax=Nonomuraea longicatena TaxID=83682 RepID=A0ABN1PI92_9ACTN